MENLTKIFCVSGQEKRVAVNNLTLDFHVGEVTALLGHNGAGKSTMMYESSVHFYFLLLFLHFLFYRKMLTGIEPPTSGTASVLGYDTWKQWPQVQKLIGLCPQQSILYDMLTTSEHLTLYGKLKGVLKPKELKKDVKR